jgi:hypothetical protein
VSCQADEPMKHAGTGEASEVSAGSGPASHACPPPESHVLRIRTTPYVLRDDPEAAFGGGLRQCLDGVKVCVKFL